MKNRLRKIKENFLTLIHIVSFFGSVAFKVIIFIAVFVVFQNDPSFIKHMNFWLFCGVCYLFYPLLLGFFKMRRDDE